MPLREVKLRNIKVNIETEISYFSSLMENKHVVLCHLCQYFIGNCFGFAPDICDNAK